MKYSKVLLLIGALLVFACEEVAAKSPAIIKGELKGLAAGKKVYLTRSTGEFTQDTIAMTYSKKKGRFTIALKPERFNELYELQFEGVRLKILLVAEKGKIKVGASSSDIFSIEIGGTPENDRYNDYRSFIYGIIKQQNEMMRSGKNKTPEGREKMDSLEKHKKKFTDSLISNSPNSVVALYLAKIPSIMMNHHQLDSVLHHFEPYFAKHQYYLEMKKRADILRKVSVGVMAPDFTVFQADGKTPITLSSFRGKYVLLDFWASWCVPCRAENKHTKEIYEQYHPKGLEIISFSLDSDQKAWVQAIEKDELVWHNASDLIGGVRSPVAQRYGIDGIPAIWLIDPSGKIIGDNIRGEKLQKLLQSVFK